ncbi:TlpA family protein disulfide reductase [Candidatus Uhrbacteria bacterium]|nr:TlpA family protein disulfide reductase [Candidatus Uhrbacteria bacterium]
MKIILIIGGLVGGIAVLLGFFGWNARQEPAVRQSQDSAYPLDQAESVQIPDLSLIDYQGQTVSLRSLVGEKYLVLNTWAAWCPFCVNELPDFARVQDEFRDRVLFVAVNRGEPSSVAIEFTDKLAVTDRMFFLLDPSDSFYRAIGGFSMPETLFVDREGMIRFHKRGPMDETETRSRVLELLKK